MSIQLSGMLFLRWREKLMKSLESLSHAVGQGILLDGLI